MITVATEERYLVLDGRSDPPTERETVHIGGIMDLEKTPLSLRHCRPSQQLLSSCYYNVICSVE